MAASFVTKDVIFVVETFVNNKCIGIPIPDFLHFPVKKYYICFLTLPLRRVGEALIKELKPRFLTHAI
jgi:hypothetical protein